ncbi:MAG: AEC family transporter [Verrucomicrobiota bacterium]
MLILLKLVVPILAALLGFSSARRIGVSEKWVKIIGSSITRIFLPCVIIPAMANIQLSWEIIELPIANLCIVLGLFLIAFLYVSIKKMPALEKGSFLTAFSSLEGGSIGLTLILLIYGNAAVPYFLVFDITHGLLVFTFIYFIACFYGTKNQMSWNFFCSFLLGPIPLAVIIGLVIHCVFGGLNSTASMALSSIGYLILPAVMFILGYRFNYFPQHFFSSLITLVVKMTIGFCLGLALVSLFHMSGYPKMVVLLGASLPPSFLTLVFAEEQGLAEEFLVTFLPMAGMMSFLILCFAYSTFGMICVR